MAHVDLGLTGDSAGVAIGWVEGFTKVPRSDNTFELMPQINFDLILEVKPPRNGEIEFENIRKLFYKLRELGMNLKWISFDTFQSVDSMQILRQEGFITGTALHGQDLPAVRCHQDSLLRWSREGADSTIRRCRRSCAWSVIRKAA